MAGFVCTKSSLIRCSNISYRCLRYYRAKGVDVRLGIAHDGKKIIRVLDGTEIDPRVYDARAQLVYSDYIQNYQRIFSYPKRVQALKAYASKIYKKKTKELSEKEAAQPSVSILLQKLYTEEKDEEALKLAANEAGQGKSVAHSSYMPYGSKRATLEDPVMNDPNNQYTAAYKKHITRNRATLHKYGIHFKDYLAGNDNDIPRDWMTDYEHFNDSLMRNDTVDLYGTSIPDSELSKVPCMGCGSLLHCKDHAIPGYLPSEIFIGLDQEELKNVICQRCHFLKVYNTALDIQVSPTEYEEMLMKLRDKKCAIVLVVDMTDIPCSIWPNLHRILHPESTVFIIGNKVDLMPLDGPLCLQDLTHLLHQSVISRAGLKDSQISNVLLVSAKTGFGIERFIDSLFYTWNDKGNIYLVGCTNVGKSSIFNSLIHSDYCAVGVEDILQLATVSSWPGTTLNFLKFPVRYYDGAGFKRRAERLVEEQKLLQIERDAKGELFRLYNNTKYATLEGTVGKTPALLMHDRINSNKNRRKPPKPDNVDCLWCHDTPGTINSDQILDLLTIDELKSLKANEIIQPRTFSLFAGQSVFLAGIGRVDLISASNIRCTLFSSYQLPITICHTTLADEMYKMLLQTEAFVVPINDPERLSVWPELKSKHLEVEGIGTRQSAADIVLSNAGWIAVTGDMSCKLEFNVWTPFGRGIYLRTPAYLSKSVAYRGPRINGTPMYKQGKQMYFLRDLPDLRK